MTWRPFLYQHISYVMTESIDQLIDFRDKYAGNVCISWLSSISISMYSCRLGIVSDAIPFEVKMK